MEMAPHWEFWNEFVWLAKTAHAGIGLACRGTRDITGGLTILAERLDQIDKGGSGRPKPSGRLLSAFFGIRPKACVSVVYGRLMPRPVLALL